MANSKTRPTTRMLAMLLALFTFLGVIPLSPFVLLKVSAADPGSAKPTSEMLDNFVLRALEYTGYDVQAQKDNDTLYVQGYYAGKTPSKILSGIGYGTGNGGGVATVPDSGTKTGRAPDIAKFKSGGLECGSFVSYVFLNYLPNIEGVEMQGIKEQLPNGTNSDDTWYSTLKTLTSQGKAKQITIGTPDFSLVGTLDTGDKNAEIDYVDWSKLEIGDIIVFGTESSTAHVAIYAGTCHNGWRNTHFIIHVGNERGPEISEARYMADSGSKSSVPIAVYRLIPVEPTLPPEPEVGAIEVNKHDDSGTALSGAVFTATNTSTRETVTIGPTDSRGYAKKDNVPYGTYEVVETTFPSGYTSSGTSKWTVTVGKSTPTVTVNAVNTAVDGYGKIVKVSEDGKVSGIRFHIEGSGVDMDVTTGSDGTVTQGLRPGTYTVTELASDEYVPQAARTLTVVADRTATVTFSNTLKRGTLKVTKTAYDGFVEDITFHLYGTSDSGQEVNMYATTDSSGVATFNDVLVGSNYVLEEVDTPERYVVPDIEYVDIEYNVVARADVYNDEKVGSAKVIKTSDDDNVRGIRFHLYGTANSGERVDLYATTDRDGIADFGEVPSGTGYTVEEVDVPDWYEEPREQEIDVIEGRTTEVRFHNTLKVGDLTVTKTSEDDNVSDRRFHLYGTADNGERVDEYAETNSSGNAYFRDIPIGTDYVLEEVGTPDWYIVPSPQTVDIGWNDTVECSFNNVLKRGDLRVTKTSFDGLVAGITFRLTGISDSGESVNETAVTNDAGVAEFHDILVGSNYRLEEEGAADYYVIPDIENVEVTWGDVTAQSVHNAPKVGTLKVMKTADDGKVSGRRFHLYGKADSGTVIDLYADTDGNGVATFSDVEIGKGYTVEEVDTDIRYVIPEAQDAPIEWAKVTRNMFENRLKKWRVTVTKVDIETTTAQGGAKLAGAVYGIYENGELVDTYTTDENGQFTSDYYVCGDDWTLREISPSEGYLLDDTVHHIGAENTLYEVEYNDTENRADEQVMYGNIAVIKHTDNGDTQIETPEVGAKFEIFLKAAGSYVNAKESERDILICDEIGFAQSKELPYGVYTVHQTEGWDGSDKIADFDVFISEDGKTYNFLINNRQFESYIRVVKIDAETGKAIPVAGVGFKLYDPNGEQIKMTYTYPTVTTVDTFYTNENGYLVTPEKLPFGRGYSVVEVSAPYGYVLDTTPVYFDVTEDSAEREDLLIVIEVEKADVPQKGTVTVTKTGEVFVSVIEADGVYVPVYEVRPLAGAVYEIVAADDIYTPDGTLRYASGTVVDTVTTGDDGTATSIALYLGKYTVREVKAPYGYLLNDTPVNVELVYAGENVEVTEAAASFVNDRQRVSVSLSKIMENDDLFGIGSGNEMLNVKFGLFAKNDISAADGSIIPSDGLLEVISVDEYGIGRFTVDLPLGEYYVREIATDEHYVLSDEKYPVVFDYAGQNEVTVVIEIGAIENELIYGSIKGHKTDRETGADIAGAVFGLFRHDETVFTTENAILTAISDENGIFTFENIPYGKWTIYELAPADGYLPNEEIYEVEVKSDEEVIEIDAVNDMIPDVKTTATVNGEHDIHTNVTVTIEDVVEYKHLIPGKEYVMRGVLMDKATGKPFVVNGSEVTAEVTFTPDSPSGTVVLEYTFDGSVITEDTVLVVFETLYRNGKELASHADIDDEGQTITVHIPEIGTTATADGGHTTHPKDTIKIVDVVRYENLIVGKTYTVKGILMDKSTGEPFLVNGGTVTAEKTFVAESNSGEVTVTFVFDGSGIETDTSVVAFEALYHEGRELAVHADIEDDDQTVTVLIPEIGTTANVNGEKSVHPNTEITIEDVVTFENLIPGKEYVLHGVIMNKATGEPFLDNGKEIVSEVKFKPDSSSGTVTVTFVFNGADIDANTDIVVFEKLFYKGYEVAAHADINDEGQTVTVYVPEIGTTATADGGHTTHPKDTIEIVDVVRYENLIVGKTYTVKGVLMDKSTGKAFLANGKAVTAETTFVAESESGEITVTFVFDGSGIEIDTSLVAFESLYHNDLELAVHADIENEDQTVTVLIPEIGTTATVNGEKSVHPNAEITIEDVVTFENLIPGKEYVLHGVLMNKATGEPFLVNGKEIVFEITFTPDSSSGTVIVTFTLSGNDIDENTDIVVFERLFHKGYEVASHTDIEDEGQTVTVYVPDIGTTANVGGEKSVHPNDEITIGDVVTFENLIPGKEYVLHGVIMNKATGEPFLDNGKEIVSEVKFKPDSSSGTVTVTFVFNGADIDANTDIVVFEKLFYKGYEVAAHADINDEGQTVTVYVPEIGTTATADGGHTTHPNEKIEIVDVVRYENLIVGKTYTVKGILMDKSPGEPFLVNGGTVTAETTFVAESESGEITVTFVFDGSGIETETTLVAFESLYHDDFELAVHADIEDEDQTVTVLIPEIVTTATVNGCNIAETSNEIVVEDEVRYEGLIQGKEYILRGILIDKATGNPYTVDGKEITSEAVFTASSSSGKVTVTFTFDGSGITSDTVLVVFETLYLDNSVVTRHENINDEEQTVKIIPKREIPQTGDESPSLLVPILLMLASLSGLAVCLILSRKRNRLGK